MPRKRSAERKPRKSTKRKSSNTIDFDFLKRDFKEGIKYEVGQYLMVLTMVLMDEFSNSKSTSSETFEHVFANATRNVDNFLLKVDPMDAVKTEPLVARVLKRRLMFAIWYSLLDTVGLKRTKKITVETTDVLRKAFTGALGIALISEVLYHLFKIPSIVDIVQKRYS